MAGNAEPNTERSKVAIEKLQKASPLALPGLIAECEFYDETESEKIFADVVSEFEKEGGSSSVLKPIALSIVDGLLEGTKMGRAMRKKGVTASRVLQECDEFTYGEMKIGPVPGVAYVDWKSTGEENAAAMKAFANREDRRTYRRTQLQKQNAMQQYKDTADSKAASEGRKNLVNEYTGERDLTAYRDNPDHRRNDPKHSHQAETDHVIPLKQLHDKFKGNYGLSITDIRDLANIEGNFALTSSTINRRKGDKTNAEFIEELKKSDDPKDRELAAKMEKVTAEKTKAAEKAIVGAANKAIEDNLLLGGRISRQELSAEVKKAEKKAGRKLTKTEKDSLRRKMQIKKGAAIYGEAGGVAAKQAADYAAGNAILFILKPIYFELKDSFRNGFIEGVACSSGMDAVKVRFTRVKNYIIEHGKEFLGDNLAEFVKGFISSLIEAIIGLFLGMFKCILKLIKEGIRIFIQAAKILWGKNAAKMSPAEKGDAIVKLIGGSVAALAGIGIDALLNSAGIPDSWSVPLSTMLSGIVSALFMCILDRADLFDVKDERRNARLKEVFEARVADMRADAANFSAAVNARLIEDRKRFDALDSSINAALDRQDINCVDGALSGMADLFEVALPYKDSQSFVKYWKSQSKIRIGGQDEVLSA